MKRNQATALNLMQHSSGTVLLHLLACSLHGSIPSLSQERVEWDEVYALAKQNSVESIAWDGVSRVSALVPDHLRTGWSGAADATLYRRVQFDVERERVVAALDSQGLAHLPLKGILMADYYPDPSMRSMADNDILYGFVEPCSEGGWRVKGASEEGRMESSREATRVASSLMKRLGYENQLLEHENADCFYKAPCFNFELHRSLVQDRFAFSGYFSNPWSRAIADSPGSLGFHYSASDEYIFHVAHAYKHYGDSGCGVRNAVVTYNFLRTLTAE